MRSRVPSPFDVLDDLFSVGGIDYYREGIFELVRAAGVRGVWRPDSPADVLVFVDRLAAGFGVASVLLRRRSILKTLRPRGTPHLPKVLTPEEYLDPALALRRLFKTDLPSTWLALLHRLRTYALMRESCFEAGERFDLLGIWQDLTRLMEALYEVHVRGEED